MSYFTRKIDAKEYLIVAELFNLYRVFYQQPSDLAKAAAFIKANLTQNDSVIFVVFDGEQPVAFTQLYPRCSSIQACKNWHIGDLYVAKKYRKKGIGAQLLQTAYEFAKAENANVLTLNTGIENTPAQSIYETFGFAQKDYLQGYFHYQLNLSN